MTYFHNNFAYDDGVLQNLYTVWPLSGRGHGQLSKFVNYHVQINMPLIVSAPFNDTAFKFYSELTTGNGKYNEICFNA